MEDLQKRKFEMDRYNMDHILESRKNYGYFADDTPKSMHKYKMDTAKYLNLNLDTMEEEELDLWLKKCLDLSDKKKLLLEYELKYFKEEPKEMTMEQFIKKVSEILKRYQWRAGGTLIEDSEWTIHTSASDDYEIRDYEVVFENSINTYDLDDTETQFYLDRIVRRLKNCTTNMKIDLRSHDDEFDDTVTWILIYITDIDAKKKSKNIDINI